MFPGEELDDEDDEDDDGLNERNGKVKLNQFEMLRGQSCFGLGSSCCVLKRYEHTELSERPSANTISQSRTTD